MAPRFRACPGEGRGPRRRGSAAGLDPLQFPVAAPRFCRCRLGRRQARNSAGQARAMDGRDRQAPPRRRGLYPVAAALGGLDHSFPGRVFPFIRPPAHPFRRSWGRVPATPPLAAELAIQHSGSPLETIGAPFALAGISEAIGLAAPEMPSAIRQVELRGLAIGSQALKPPAPPAIGRHDSDQPNAVALVLVAYLVGQFDESVRRVGEIDADRDREFALIEISHSRQASSRACKSVAVITYDAVPSAVPIPIRSGTSPRGAPIRSRPLKRPPLQDFPKTSAEPRRAGRNAFSRPDARDPMTAPSRGAMASNRCRRQPAARSWPADRERFQR
jgi:hypothetical protein